MRPVVTVDEMRAIDALSPVPESELIRRAGTAVYFAARQMLGGTYGRRVTVVAGKGNNGADGRVAAELLCDAGVRARVVAPGEHTETCDLVIDAAYGTGFRGEYSAPIGSAPVLAVDIPSGVDGDTGAACLGAVRASRTVTFGALKPGLLFGDGPEHAGETEVVDIGLDVSRTHIAVSEDADVFDVVPRRQRNAHKWRSSVAVIAGSPGMLGAARLAAIGAARAGAGMVRLLVPGADDHDLPAGDAVSVPLPKEGWATHALKGAEKAKAIVIGPGLGRDESTITEVRSVVSRATVPVVVDADALYVVSEGVLENRNAPTVMTPHDGEFETLTGAQPSGRRWESAADLARRSNSVVLLKGPTSTVVSPQGEVVLTTSGDQRLATAGTGDVLSGIIGALIAQGIDPFRSTWAGAHIHGAAAKLGFPHGLVAGDLPDCVATWLSSATMVGNA